MSKADKQPYSFLISFGVATHNHSTYQSIESQCIAAV
jgi:hypothetical protein